MSDAVSNGALSGENVSTSFPAAGGEEKTAGVTTPDAGESKQQTTGGKGVPDAGGQKPETPAERQARWEAMVGKGGEFSDLFRRATQEAVKGRLAESKRVMAAQQPVLDLLMARYGTQDLTELQAAIQADTAWWQSYADQVGGTEKDARERLTMQAELERRRRADAQAEGERRVQAQMEEWNRQIPQVQAVYPEFDIHEAMANEEFTSLVRAGVSMKAAYELCHMDDIKTAIARSAAKDAESRLAQSIQANGARPVEGGASAQVGASTKLDPAKMSSKEILDMAERAMRGEHIHFN